MVRYRLTAAGDRDAFYQKKIVMSAKVPLNDRPAAPRLPKTERKQGFAVVIALSLMSFALVLILTLSTLVSVETTLAQTETERLLARQNARLAAMIALGDLQKTMGPDQRVSAPAAILSTDNDDDPDDGVSPFDADEVTRFWSGVWDSQDWDPGNAEDREGRFDRWLVSLPEELSEEIDSVASTSAVVAELKDPDSDQTVTLAKIHAVPYSGSPAEETEVRAYLRAVSENSQMAWWVSDEGVKANPGLVDPNRGKSAGSTVADIPRFLFPHRHNFGATEWFAGTDFDDEDLVANLRKLGNSQLSLEAALAGADIEAEAESAIIDDDDTLFADYSFYTHGVLSSNRRGGLRGDLSLALWQESSELIVFNPPAVSSNRGFENNFSKRRIFNFQDYEGQSISSPTASGKRYYAPRWEVLRDYHNSFETIADIGTVNERTVPLLDAGGRGVLDLLRNSEGGSSSISFEQATDDHLHNFAPLAVNAEVVDGSGKAMNPITSPITPVILRVNIQFELASVATPRVDSGDNTIYELEMRLRPTVLLWNPYNIGISRQALNGTFVKQPTLNWDHHSNDRFSIDFDIDGEDLTLVGGRDDPRRIYTSSKILMALNRDSPELDYFAPGEIKMYKVEATTSADGAGFRSTVDLTSKFTSADAYLTLSQKFAELGIEKTSGETVAVITQTKGSAGPRPSLSPAKTGKLNNILAQRFRINTESEFGPETKILTVDGVNTVVMGSIDLQLLPGTPDEPSSFNPRRFADFNVRALYPKGGMSNAYDGEIPNYWLKFLSSDPDIQRTNGTMGGATVMRGFWGATTGNTVGSSSFVSLFDVPRRPPESIGQYQHAHLANIYPHYPTYPLGNSLASAHVRRPYAVDYSSSARRTFMDISWLLNDTIWDDYFLSTIDPYDVDGQNPDRLAPLRERFFELDTSVEYDPTGEDDYQNVAENLLLRGAFNVNSVSVEAWVALLASLGGDGIAYFLPESGAQAQTSSMQYPFYRMTIPRGPQDSLWTGGPRDLSDVQIRNLAENMVEEVKRRGPFLSLSDFINRRLAADDRGLSGAIQAALDKETADIQSVVPELGAVSLSSAPATENVSGGVLDGAPGDVSQADVLTSIGPVISVRSDTFVIRSYGRTTGLNGQTNGEVWCEMLVQRFPQEHTESSMGRPFRILNFRYLDEGEI